MCAAPHGVSLVSSASRLTCSTYPSAARLASQPWFWQVFYASGAALMLPAFPEIAPTDPQPKLHTHRSTQSGGRAMFVERSVRRLLGLVLVATVFAFTSCATEQPTEQTGQVEQAVTVPSGFTDETFVSGLSLPTAMAFTPDGRILVCQQGGQLRVVKNGALLAAPFAHVSAHVGGGATARRRGDPDFLTNGFVYVTTRAYPAVHTASPIKANGDVALAGSELVLMELDNLSSAVHHNGGACTSARWQALHRCRENANRNTPATNRLARCSGSSRRSIPSDNPSSSASGASFDLELGTRKPSPSVFSRPGRSSSTMSAKITGRDRRRHRGLELRLAADRGRHQRSAISGAAVYLFSRSGGSKVAPSPAARSTTPARFSFRELPGKYFFADY